MSSGSKNSPGYVIYLKNNSHFVTDEAGNILFDGDRNTAFRADGRWKILGFARRHTANRIQVSLRAAADGEDLGQGWVFDLDHGMTRMWGSPGHRRAKRVLHVSDVYDFMPRRNPSGSDKVRVLGIYPGGEVKELMVTAESLTWRKGKRKRDDRLSGPFLRKFGSYPVATIAMWGSDPDFHDEAKVREMLSRYLRDSGRDERRNPARRRSRDGVSREWRWA